MRNNKSDFALPHEFNTITSKQILMVERVKVEAKIRIGKSFARSFDLVIR